MTDYMSKAVKEAKVHSSWVHPIHNMMTPCRASSPLPVRQKSRASSILLVIPASGAPGAPSTRSPI